MKSKTKVTLNICGVELAVVAEEDVEYIRKVGRMVEDKMSRLLEGNSRLSMTMAALFTALDMCDELVKTREAADNMRAQLRPYVEEAERARAETEAARREISRLEREVQNLKIQLARVEGAYMKER